MDIGKACKNYRKSINKKLVDVAVDTNYSVSNISKFEHNEVNNIHIFMWYIKNGMDIKTVMES